MTPVISRFFQGGYGKGVIITHFTEWKTEAQKCLLTKGHLARAKWQSQDQKLHLSGSKNHMFGASIVV